jgi:hypothetical protein
LVAGVVVKNPSALFLSIGARSNRRDADADAGRRERLGADRVEAEAGGGIMPFCELLTETSRPSRRGDSRSIRETARIDQSSAGWPPHPSPA